jgi:hypothetical protein
VTEATHGARFIVSTTSRIIRRTGDGASGAPWLWEPGSMEAYAGNQRKAMKHRSRDARR